ncbi:hypothetical protein Q3G72_031107 [Acer saccharum]|nr:hypothetical protein Q3G72_031107 [Acer saccharum]
MEIRLQMKLEVAAMVDFDLGFGLVWVVVWWWWWWWWLDFGDGDGDGCPQLGLDLGLVMGGFVVQWGSGKVVGGSSWQQQGCRGGSKVVGFGVGDRIWISRVGLGALVHEGWGVGLDLGLIGGEMRGGQASSQHRNEWWVSSVLELYCEMEGWVYERRGGSSWFMTAR